MTAITIDTANPKLQYRVDTYVIPEAARREFHEAMERNMAFIEKLPGFRGHVVLEKTGGPGAFNLTTIAVWASKEAYERAGEEVRAYYRRIGFDPAAALSRWGVRGEQGVFESRGP